MRDRDAPTRRAAAWDVMSWVVSRVAGAAVIVGILWFFWGGGLGLGTAEVDGNYREPVEFVEPDANSFPAGDADPEPGLFGPESATETGCVIKGNISVDTGEAIYHVPGQAYYDATVINEGYGERWFCTEEEAQAAGWRKTEV